MPILIPPKNAGHAGIGPILIPTPALVQSYQYIVIVAHGSAHRHDADATDYIANIILSAI